MNTRQNRAGSFNYVSALIAALRCYGNERRPPVLRELEAVPLIRQHFGTKLNEKYSADQELNLLIPM